MISHKKMEKFAFFSYVSDEAILTLDPIYKENPICFGLEFLMFCGI